MEYPTLPYAQFRPNTNSRRAGHLSIACRPSTFATEACYCTYVLSKQAGMEHHVLISVRGQGFNPIEIISEVTEWAEFFPWAFDTKPRHS